MYGLELLRHLTISIERGDSESSGLSDRLDRAGCLTEQLAQAAVTLGAVLRECDDLRFPERHDAAERQSARLLREASRRWADDSDGLLDCARRLRNLGATVPGIDALADAVGRTRAMLQVTPEEVDEARAQSLRGEEFTREEMRRELLTRLQRQGPAGVGRIGGVATGRDAG